MNSKLKKIITGRNVAHITDLGQLKLNKKIAETLKKR
jgi:hypothetical protein